MSKQDKLRLLMKRRLDAAAQDICDLSEAYERERSLLKENERLRKLLYALHNPQVQLRRSVFAAEVPPEVRPSLDQENPEYPRIKEQGEQLQELEEADILKCKGDEEKPQSSQLHQSQTGESREVEPPASSSAQQIETEGDGEDCEGPEDPHGHLQPETDGKTSLSSVIRAPASVFPADFPLELSPRLDQEDPEYPHIKMQLQRLEEADISMGEDDEEEPQSSQLHQSQTGESREPEPPASSSAQQIETEGDGEDCGGPEDPHGHLSSIIGKKPLGCNVCKKTFGTMYKLKSHMRVHTTEKPFGCSVCEKRFNLKSYLQRHMRVHKGERAFCCSVCEKRFNVKSYLQKHMRVHTGEKPFGCSVCEKRFNVKSYLQRHMRVHTGERAFCCSVCEKRFNVKSYLQKHMRVHTGEKPFGCSVCEKRFTRNSYLQEHMRVHTGERAFCCSVCEKRFNVKSYLQKHMRVHTGEKPFGCSVCEKRFTRNNYLQEHMRVHTGEKETWPGDSCLCVVLVLSPGLAGIAPASLRQDAATIALARKAQKYDWHILHATPSMDLAEPSTHWGRPLQVISEEVEPIGQCGMQVW
ncbi:zinc finger protein 547-like [Epinephelus fuscoguttatus]|uniref:zinc finger protein 547-like n=1 Tax=Epinephelus fuscoguttatus TaxID=293821 RepID=UPI0020D0169E|nr:zinc finger protein 547-like [Epinephelus fuscoguttatus]